MEVDAKPTAATTPVATTPKSAGGASQVAKKQQMLSRKTATPSPELELYIHLLVLLYLTDEKKNELALQCAKSLIESVERYDKRSLDPFLAKGYFYLSLISERVGQIATLPTYVFFWKNDYALLNAFLIAILMVVCASQRFIISTIPRRRSSSVFCAPIC